MSTLAIPVAAPGVAAQAVTRGVPTVWICLAVHNRIHYTRKCLELLDAQTYPHVRPVVVDDGSSDGTSAMINAAFPRTVLLHGDGCLYWTPAMHLGVAHILSQAEPEDYLLLLNDDLLFDPTFVAQMVSQSQLYPDALIQAVESSADDPDLIWQGGTSLNWWTAKHRLLNFHGRRSAFPQGHVEEAGYLTARGVLVPSRIVRAIGNYDKRFRQCGDGEWTRRAAKHGYKLLVCYDVPVLSYEKGKNLNETERYYPSDFPRFFFGVLSNYRLSTRWLQARSMTTSLLQSLTFFGCDLLRIAVHFASRLRFSRKVGLS